MAWECLEEAESTREPVFRVFDDAPAVLRKELKALRLKAEQKALVQRYELRFLSIFCDLGGCLLYTSPSPRDKRQSRMPSSA